MQVGLEGPIPPAELRRRRLTAWRMVEAQHELATAKLVDDPDEQQVLEQLIEDAKPDATRGADAQAFVGLHYLLATPFRYPPLRYGSRFGSADERGIWYGARVLPTVLAEVAFYRLLFLEGTTASIELLETTHTAFAAAVDSRRVVDIGREVFDRVRALVASPASHAAGRQFGRVLRTAGAEVLVFPSARDPEHRDNVAVFGPAAFGSREPKQGSAQTWNCATRPHVVAFRRVGTERLPAVVFERADFELDDGSLPDPG